MRLLLLVIVALFTVSAVAQEPARKKKKATQLAHKKPTPEQIRKFKDLEKKQKR